jgi:uncharacterized membrane protein
MNKASRPPSGAPSDSISGAGSSTTTSPGSSSTAPPSNPNLPGLGVRSARAVALVGLVALIALCLAWELWLAPTGKGSLALKVVPLVLCLAGLLRHRMVIFRWLALLLWLYVLEGLVRATTERGLSQALALGEVALCLVLFTASTFYIRWRLRNGAEQTQALAPTTAAAQPAP